ncbi:hypothetical protein Bbelb_398370 [Branchiostoma belcheri]|nr:hypothetical protein Bbelb_398370 [Branchiostoma belcheri]
MRVIIETLKKHRVGQLPLKGGDVHWEWEERRVTSDASTPIETAAVPTVQPLLAKMITKTHLLLLVNVVLNGAGQGIVFTGECRSDDHCLRHVSPDTCCAFWDPKGGLNVCKKLGERHPLPVQRQENNLDLPLWSRPYVPTTAPGRKVWNMPVNNIKFGICERDDVRGEKVTRRRISTPVQTWLVHSCRQHVSGKSAQ